MNFLGSIGFYIMLEGFDVLLAGGRIWNETDVRQWICVETMFAVLAANGFDNR